MTPVQLRQVSAFLLCIAGVFFLPYLFPPSHGISMAYMAGFSSRAAEVTLLAGSLAFALWTRGWGLRLAQQEVATPRRWWLLPVVATAGAAAGCGALWYVSRGLGPSFEATYFLDRFCAQTAGDHVYRDFTFDYGPLLYYPSWWLAALLHVPVGHAYYLFFGLEWVAGLLCLWYVLLCLQSRTVDRVLTFVLVGAIWLTSLLDGGAQYTPVRFLLSSVCAIAVHRLWLREEGRSRWQGTLRLVAVATFGFLLLVLLSPEQGFAFLLGTLLFFGICVRSREALAAMLGLLVLCAVVVAVVARFGLLRTIFAFNGGDFNLPILAGPQTLVLLPLLVVAACLVIQAFRSGQQRRVELYLIALALVSLPAAFARADPGHIFINTLPALLVVTLALLQSYPAGGFVLAGWTLYLFTAYVTHARPRLNVLLHSAPPLIRMPSRSELPPPSATLLAPMGYFSLLDGQVGPPVHTGRYFGFGLIFDGIAEEKIRELQQHPHDLVVVPIGWQGLCNMIDPDHTAGILHSLFLSIYTPNLKPAHNAKLPLCQFLRANYVTTRYAMPDYGQEVLAPRAEARDPRLEFLPAGVAPAAAGIPADAGVSGDK